MVLKFKVTPPPIHTEQSILSRLFLWNRPNVGYFAFGTVCRSWPSEARLLLVRSAFRLRVSISLLRSHVLPIDMKFGTNVLGTRSEWTYVYEFCCLSTRFKMVTVLWVFFSVTVKRLGRLSLNLEATYLLQRRSDVCIRIFPFQDGGHYLIIFRSQGQTPWSIPMKFGFFRYICITSLLFGTLINLTEVRWKIQS